MLPRKLRRWRDQRRLNDPDFQFLFEPDTTGEYACFDLETTGLDPKSDEILSIGAVIIRGNRVLASQHLNLLVKCDKRINEEAIKAHQLRQIDVVNGIPPQEALTKLLHFIGSRPLVGYYLEFDVAMVNRYLKAWLNITLPNEQTEVSAMYYDWKTRRGIDRHVDLRFDTILKDLNLPELPKHNPVNDALMAAMAYVKLTHTEYVAPREA